MNFFGAVGRDGRDPILAAIRITIRIQELFYEGYI